MTTQPEQDHETIEEPPPGVRTMAVVRWLLVATMGVIAALSIAHSYGHVHADESNASQQYYCPMHPQIVQDQPGECPICGMSLVSKPNGSKTTQAGAQDVKPGKPADHAGHRHEPSDPFNCPMHVEETGLDGNARCPICKMKLEPKPAAAASETKQPAKPASAAAHGEHAASPTSSTEAVRGVPGLVPVQLALDRVQLIGMRTAKVTREALTPELKAIGYVSPDEAKFARVHARFSGWVEKLSVGTTGQKVRRGQVLASIYNLELLPAQQEFLAARKWSTDSTTPGAPPATPMTGSLAADARQRLELLGMSPAEIDRIAQSGAPSRTVAVAAPISGTVMRKDVTLGAYIQPGTALFEIADLSKVWVIAEIYEHEMSRIQPGQPARFETQSQPGHSFVGKVAFIYPTIDMNTRTLRIRVELDNKDAKLRPGMYGQLLLQLAHANALVMPTEALVDTGEHQYVFLAKEGGRFEPRLVRTGARTGDKVQVQHGLQEGDVVVTTANFLIDSESRLRATIENAPAN